MRGDTSAPFEDPTARRVSSNWAARSAPWLALFGMVVLLVGLGLDALLHRLDPTLSLREGVFTLQNPGHFLFALGLAIVVASGALFLVGQLASEASWLRRVVALFLLFGLLGIWMISYGLAASSDGSSLAGHVHGSPATTAVASAGQTHVHTSGDPTAPVTPAQRAAANQLASQVRAGTARFADFSVAQSEGYRQVTQFPLPSLKGPYGPAHYLNVTYAVTYATSGNYLDPAHPGELVYFRMPDGKMLLLGAMFLAPVGLGPRPGGALTTWHTHDNLCFDGSMYTLAAAAGACPAGSRHVDDNFEMMHVWTFDNPDGPFASDLTRADYLAAIRGAKT